MLSLQRRNKYENVKTTSSRSHIAQPLTNTIVCTPHNFQFTLPTQTATILTATPSQQRKANTSPITDQRKQSIKQKIKFRVKQEIWNILKKNFPKNEQATPQIHSPIPNPHPRKENRSKSFVLIKGTSMSQVRREKLHHRKHSEMEALQQNFGPSGKDLSSSLLYNGSGEGKRRRVWSSAVKMKQKELMLLERSEHRISLSAVNFQKLQAIKIEPWKHFQDPQVNIE